MVALEVTLAISVMDGREFALQNWHQEVPRTAGRLKEPGVDALRLVLDEVQHRVDHPFRCKDLAVVGNPSLRLHKGHASILQGGIDARPTFFPLTGLPGWVQALAQLNPLFHCVELVRGAAFGWQGWADVWHFSFLILFGFLMWRVAIAAMERKLID